MTLHLDRILVPTDLSDFSGLAVKYGALFSRRLGSKLTLLFVDEAFVPLDIQAMPMVYSFDTDPAFKERMEQQARLYAPGVAVDTKILTDAPSRAIVSVAEEIDAGLIIMGTHGRHGFERAFLGSVTERVLRNTDRPVLSVCPLHFAPEGEIAVRRILCPVNFTDIGRAALAYAAELTNRFSAELVVTYVVETSDQRALSHIGPDLAAWIAPTVGNRMRYREVVAHGDAAARVLETVADVDADLVVIGSQHRFFSDATVIGTTTERVTRFARVPVVTVPLKPELKTSVSRERLQVRDELPSALFR